MQENGLIRNADIFIEDHGILTAYLDLEFNDSGQGFGGYAFDWNPPGGRRYSATCTLFIRRVLDTVGKQHWKDLPGTVVRVKRKDSFGTIIAIGHAVKDQWFAPGDEFAPFVQQEGAA